MGQIDASTHERNGQIHDIAHGLLYLHTRRPPIVHGDMKPVGRRELVFQNSTEFGLQENVLVDDDGRAQVIDFGLSTILDGISTGETSPSFATAGTLHFMAPELVQDNDRGGHCRTQGSDIWAYGCTSMQVCF